MSRIFLTCYRCGDLTTPATAAVPGLPCCRGCLGRSATPGLTIAIIPPRRILLKRAWSLAPFAVPTLLAGLVLTLILAGPDTPPRFLASTFLGVLITGVVVLMQLMVLTPGRFFLGAVETWRDDLLASTGLGAAIAGTGLEARLVLYYVDRPATLHPGARRTAALLVEGAAGLLIVTGDGLMEAFAFDALVEVRTERLWSLLPSRVVTVLTFRDSLGAETTRRLDFAEGSSFAESKALTLALAERCRARRTSQIDDPHA